MMYHRHRLAYNVPNTITKPTSMGAKIRKQFGLVGGQPATQRPVALSHQENVIGKRSGHSMNR
eukprot:2975293-Karenia_brevis.AAC.1